MKEKYVCKDIFIKTNIDYKRVLKDKI